MKFPHDKPNGIDLGDNTVYFSDGFGDYPGGGSGTQYVSLHYLSKRMFELAHLLIFTQLVCRLRRYHAAQGREQSLVHGGCQIEDMYPLQRCQR